MKYKVGRVYRQLYRGCTIVWRCLRVERKGLHAREGEILWSDMYIGEVQQGGWWAGLPDEEHEELTEEETLMYQLQGKPT